MADKFKEGDILTAKWTPQNEKDPRNIVVKVIEQESPGMYRVATDMGIAILFKEDDLG